MSVLRRGHGGILRRALDGLRRGRARSEPFVVEYNPRPDGDADPGEIVWAWVAYEDDPSKGKDRPVVIVGRRGRRLVGVALTSQRRERARDVPVGTGPWDSRRRPSYAKVDRLLDLEERSVRREGCALPRPQFDAVVAAARHEHAEAFR